MVQSYRWVSSRLMTVKVVVDDDTDIIVEAAPIVRKFVGQPFSNLARWMKRHQEFCYVSYFVKEEPCP